MRESLTYCMDCLEAMRQMPDKAFDLAVVDPPYGSGGGYSLEAKVRRALRPIQRGGGQPGPAEPGRQNTAKKS